MMTSDTRNHQIINDFLPDRDIVFRHAGGNLNHRAQRIYRNAVHDTFESWLQEDDIRIVKRLVYNQDLIDTIKENIESSIQTFRIVKRNEDTERYHLITDEDEMDKLIWISVKRKKSQLNKKMNTDYHLRNFLNKSLKNQQQPSEDEIQSSDDSDIDNEIKKKDRKLKRIGFDPEKKRKFKKLIRSSDSDTSNVSDKKKSINSKNKSKLSKNNQISKKRKQKHDDSSYSTEEGKKSTTSRKKQLKSSVLSYRKKKQKKIKEIVDSDDYNSDYENEDKTNKFIGKGRKSINRSNTSKEKTNNKDISIDRDCIQQIRTKLPRKAKVKVTKESSNISNKSKPFNHPPEINKNDARPNQSIRNVGLKMLNRLSNKIEKKKTSKVYKKSIEANFEKSSPEFDNPNDEDDLNKKEKCDLDEKQDNYGNDDNSSSICNESESSNLDINDNEQNINSIDEKISESDSPYYCSNSSSTFDGRRIMCGERISNRSNLQTLVFDSIVQSSDLQEKDQNLFDSSNVLDNANELDPINKTIVFNSIKNISEKTVDEQNMLKINDVFYEKNDDSKQIDKSAISMENIVKEKEPFIPKNNNNNNENTITSNIQKKPNIINLGMIGWKPISDDLYKQRLEQSHLSVRKNYMNKNGKKIPILKTPAIDDRQIIEINTKMTETALIKKFGLYKANVPGDGNCAFTSIMAHVNELDDVNYNVWDRSLITFRKWFSNEYMKIQCNPDIYEYLDFESRRLCIMLAAKDDPYLFWYNKTIRNQYILKEKNHGYIPEDFWLDSENMFPYLSFMLKKSIVVFQALESKKQPGKYLKKGMYGYVRYDDRNPHMFPCWQFSDYGKYQLEEITGVVEEFKTFYIDPNQTLFFIHYVPMHFDAFVTKRRTVTLLGDGEFPDMNDFVYTSTNENRKYYVSDKEYENTKNKYQATVQSLVHDYKAPMKKNNEHNDKAKNKE